MTDFSESATRSGVCSADAKKSFQAWDQSTERLRVAIVDMQDRIPDPVPAHTSPQPLIAGVNAPMLQHLKPAPASIIGALYRVGRDQGFWQDVPQIYAVVRRTRKILTSGPSGGLDVDCHRSAAWKFYISNLVNKFAEFQNKAYMSRTAEQWGSVKSIVSFCVPIWVTMRDTPPLDVSRYSTGWVPHCFTEWGKLHSFVPVAAYHRSLTTAVEVWDPNDMMDRLFYVSTTSVVIVIRS